MAKKLLTLIFLLGLAFLSLAAQAGTTINRSAADGMGLRDEDGFVVENSNCAADLQKRKQGAAAIFMVITTPTDKQKDFQLGVADMVDLISSFDVGVSFTALMDFDWDAIMSALMDKLEDEVMKVACDMGSGNFENAINNAMKNITGTLQGACEVLNMSHY